MNDQNDLTKKIKPIRLFILDVDGTLTSGRLYYYGNQVEEMRDFHIHDGMGIKLLQKTGIKIAVISGKNSSSVEKRLQDLNIEHIYLGHEDKLPIYENLKQTLQLQDHEIAYMGDDLPDLPLLIRAGFSATVTNAPEIIKQYVNFITDNKPGQGAVREVCELIMKTQNSYQSVIQSYLT